MRQCVNYRSLKSLFRHRLKFLSAIIIIIYKCHIYTADEFINTHCAVNTVCFNNTTTSCMAASECDILNGQLTRQCVNQCTFYKDNSIKYYIIVQNTVCPPRIVSIVILRGGKVLLDQQFHKILLFDIILKIGGTGTF